MAPRGRERPKKQFSDSRMGAAWDAMRPLGFARYWVVKTVKELLEVYGGEEGWPFIEEYSYKVLLEAILEKVEAMEKKKNEAGGASASNTLAIEAPAGNTCLVSASEADHVDDAMQLAEVPDTTTTQTSNAVLINSPQSRCTDSNRGWVSEVQLTGPEPLDETISAQTSTTAINSPPPGFTTKQACTPCYGWISEDVQLPDPDVPKRQTSNAEFNSPPLGFTKKNTHTPYGGWISEEGQLPEPEVPKTQTGNAEFKSPPPGFTTKFTHTPCGGWISEEVQLPEPDVLDTNTAKTSNAEIHSPPPGFNTKKTRSPCGGWISEEVQLPEPKVLDTRAKTSNAEIHSPPPGFNTKKTRSPCGGWISEEVQLPEPKVLDTTAKTSNAVINSPPTGFTDAKRKRKPYFGWISEDREEDLIELKPGPLAEKVAKLLLEHGGPKRKKWDVKSDQGK